MPGPDSDASLACALVFVRNGHVTAAVLVIGEKRADLLQG
jgi:hypothetical protein